MSNIRPCPAERPKRKRSLRRTCCRANGRNRRVSPIAVRLGEGRLAEPRAGARSWRRVPRPGRSAGTIGRSLRPGHPPQGRPRIAPTDQQTGGNFRLKPRPAREVVTSQPRERPSRVYSAYHRLVTGARPTRRVVGGRSAKSSPLRSIYCKMTNGHACRRCRPDPQTLSRHARHGLRRPDRACGPVRLPRTGRGA